MWLRRLHLYSGLLMLPWVILYAITAIFFNHPFIWSDQSIVTFDKHDLAETPLALPPQPQELARSVAERLQTEFPQSRFQTDSVKNARYNREFGFATVMTDALEISMLFEATGQGGTIRYKPIAPPKPLVEPAPFIAKNRTPDQLKPREPSFDRNFAATLKIKSTLVETLQATAPMVLEKKGLPLGQITVTSVPDVTFIMDVDGTPCRITHNASTGVTTATRADQESPAEPLSMRRILTRMHLAHGYPYEFGTKLIWALIVDAMALVMLFWSFSGLFMWWQIKATRKLGAVVLAISLIAAISVGTAMYILLTTANRVG